MSDCCQKTIEAVFFDMDGVLYDSMPNHEYSWCKVFESVGMSFAPEEAYANEGRTARGTINIVYNRSIGRDATDEEIESLYALKTKLMSERPAAEPFADMMRLLPQLQQMGVEVYVVTGSRQPWLYDNLERDFGVERAKIISGNDVKIGKPSAEPYLMAQARANKDKEHCIVVENAPLGVRAGKAAEIEVWAVNTGKLADHYLTDEGADFLFHTPRQLSAELIARVCRK